VSVFQTVANYFKRKHIMTLRSILDDAKALEASAQAVFTEAQTKVQAAQAAVDAALPHISLLAKIESEVANMEEGVGSRVTLALSEIKSLFNL
jgi:hypothetical protein